MTKAKTVSQLICQACGKRCLRTGRRQLVCADCRVGVERVRSRHAMRRYRDRKYPDRPRRGPRKS